MEIAIKCPNCGSKVNVDAEQIGIDIICPFCEDVFKVPTTPVMAGMILGDYWVQSKIGPGDLGEVFVAKEMTDAGRKVALKVLAPVYMDDPEAVGGFLEEAQRAIDIDHPGIVSVLSADIADNNAFVASLFVEGENVADRIEREGVISEKEALRIVLKAARALCHACREHGILHGDVKPSNVMIDAAGNVCILDLGVYKFLLQPVGVTVTGENSATLDYLSPELGRGDVEWDERADIYSLGATLYHMVTGSPPFNGSTATDVISQHLYDPLPQPQDVNPNLSADCAAIINRMMAKSPDERYEDWESLIQELKALLKTKHASSTQMINVAEAIPQEVLEQQHEIATDGPPAPTASNLGRRIIVITAVISLLIFIFAMLMIPKFLPDADQHNTASPRRPAEKRQAEEAANTQRLAELEEALQAAIKWSEDNPEPENYTDALKRLKDVRTAGVGTKYQDLAQQEILKLRDAREKYLQNLTLPPAKPNKNQGNKQNNNKNQGNKQNNNKNQGNKQNNNKN